MYHGTTPLGTTDLGRSPDSQTRPLSPKERNPGPTVGAQIKIHHATVLVGAGAVEAGLGTQRVVISGGAQVTYHDDDAGSGVAEFVARAVGFADQAPACPTGGTGALSRAGAVEVLRHGGTVAWRGIEATGCGGSLTVAAEAVSFAVPGDGCVVGCAAAVVTAGWRGGLGRRWGQRCGGSRWRSGVTAAAGWWCQTLAVVRILVLAGIWCYASGVAFPVDASA